jgi:hypothetical protein
MSRRGTALFKPQGNGVINLLGFRKMGGNICPDGLRVTRLRVGVYRSCNHLV